MAERPHIVVYEEDRRILKATAALSDATIAEVVRALVRRDVDLINHPSVRVLLYPLQGGATPSDRDVVVRDLESACEVTPACRHVLASERAHRTLKHLAIDTGSTISNVLDALVLGEGPLVGHPEICAHQRRYDV